MVTCDQRQDLMLSFAVGALEPTEIEELRTHLSSGCPGCAIALAEAEAVVAHLPLGLAPVAPDPSLRNRVMSGLKPQQREGSIRINPTPTLAASQRNPVLRLVSYAIAACIGAGFGAMAIQYWFANPAQKEVSSLNAKVSDRDQAMGRLQLAMADQKVKLAELLNMVGSKDLRLVSFDRTDTQKSATGRILWDRATNRWQVNVFDMKAPEANKAYELWFITTDQKKVPAGMLEVDASGNGQMIVAVPQDIGPIALAAFTDEPIGGSAQPTGSIHLVGKMQ